MTVEPMVEAFHALKACTTQAMNELINLRVPDVEAGVVGPLLFQTFMEYYIDKKIPDDYIDSYDMRGRIGEEVMTMAQKELRIAGSKITGSRDSCLLRLKDIDKTTHYEDLAARTFNKLDEAVTKLKKNIKIFRKLTGLVSMLAGTSRY